MKIPINKFEQYIDATILKRGLSYYRNGKVNEPMVKAEGEYEAIVEGTENYTVQIKIMKNEIVEFVCNCPYDLGPVCKHVAALLFYLQKDELEFKQKPTGQKKVKREKLAKRKTVTDQVNRLLEDIPRDELKQFVLDHAGGDPSFRNNLVSNFAHLNSGESQQFYSKQVRSILRSAGRQHGFIDWSAARYVGKAVFDLLNTANKHIENKNYKSAILICCAVMEEMTGALEYADDSNGDIGGNIDHAYHLLSEIALKEPPEEIRKLLFEYCISSFGKKIYSGWDWHIGMAELAATIFITDVEARRVLISLDTVRQSDFEMEEAQLIKFNIIKKTKGKKEARKFLSRNLKNPRLRREAISLEIANENYDEAIALAREGIKQDEKEKPGLAMEWYDWLLKTAQAQNDEERIIEYARRLFIDNFRHEQDYYQVLKHSVREEEWQDFIGSLIKEIKLRRGWNSFELLPQIYIKEGRWNDLLELIKDSPTFYQLDDYGKFLINDFKNDLILLYRKAIETYAKENTGRNHYQTVCRYLRKMIKLGARDEVNNIIEMFRENYSLRKAFMEELDRV